MSAIAIDADGTRTTQELPPQVAFIPNEEFSEGDEEHFLRIPPGESLYSDRETDGIANISAGCSEESLHALPLLSSAGEAFLFRKMNYLRFRAAEIRDRIDEEHPSAADRQEMLHLLEMAEAARNHIAECNLRLVISIARKFATDQNDFDDLVSEAHMILLKAIDKFDFARGFRFSTYATHSVQRHFFRVSKQKQRRRHMEMSSPAEMMNEVPASAVVGESELAAMLMEEERLKTLLMRMHECLNEREQFIIKERFGISEEGVVRTLRDVASEIGLSKERVRQIQIVAVDKLRTFFSRYHAEPMSV